MQTKSILTIAIAAATIAVGSLAGTGDASAKKGGGYHGGKHGGYHGQKWHGHKWHGHKWHGYRWHGRHFYYAPAFYGFEEPCYFVRKRGRSLKVCPY